MPVINLRLDLDVRISVSAHYLKKTRAPELLRGAVDFNSPGLRFSGVTTKRYERNDGKTVFNVRFDDLLPNITFNLFGSSLKYGGPRVPVTHPTVAASTLDLPEQAIAEDDKSSSSEEEQEEIYLTPVDSNSWRITEVPTDSFDHLVLLPHQQVLCLSCRLFFLPPIRETANTHALSVVTNWVDITFVEYLTWVSLLVVMSVVNHVDK
jgi:hypothetical protein